MKTVLIELNRKTLSQTTEMAIVQNIERHFTIEDDSQDKYVNLRFVLVNGEDLTTDFNGINIELRSVTKPHNCVSIAKDFVYAVEVVL